MRALLDFQTRNTDMVPHIMPILIRHLMMPNGRSLTQNGLYALCLWPDQADAALASCIRQLLDRFDVDWSPGDDVNNNNDDDDDNDDNNNDDDDDNDVISDEDEEEDDPMIYFPDRMLLVMFRRALMYVSAVLPASRHTREADEVLESCYGLPKEAFLHEEAAPTDLDIMHIIQPEGWLRFRCVPEKVWDATLALARNHEDDITQPMFNLSPHIKLLCLAYMHAATHSA
jgi:hypothetical protein